MKFSSIYKNSLGCGNEDEVFEYLMGNLNESITYWDYFVNWPKVTKNVQQHEMDLNTLNYLVGKTDVKTAFEDLLRRQGTIASLVPVLLACRDKKFKILVDVIDGKLVYENFDFKLKKNLTGQEINAVSRFASETGLLKMFSEKQIKSVPDYVTGLEAGLDSNGRKNRSGSSMELIVSRLLAPLCRKHGFKLMLQAKATDIKNAWGVELLLDKASRSFDFAVKTSDQLFLIETNYYSGGGSKLKSTAGEYRGLFDTLDKQGLEFVWITDGLGWRTAEKPLRDTFDHSNHVLNLKMIMAGLLEGVLCNG